MDERGVGMLSYWYIAYRFESSLSGKAQYGNMAICMAHPHFCPTLAKEYVKESRQLRGEHVVILFFGELDEAGYEVMS